MRVVIRIELEGRAEPYLAHAVDEKIHPGRAVPLGVAEVVAVPPEIANVRPLEAVKGEGVPFPNQVRRIRSLDVPCGSVPLGVLQPRVAVVAVRDARAVQRIKGDRGVPAHVRSIDHLMDPDGARPPRMHQAPAGMVRDVRAARAVEGQRREDLRAPHRAHGLDVPNRSVVPGVLEGSTRRVLIGDVRVSGGVDRNGGVGPNVAERIDHAHVPARCGGRLTDEGESDEET